MLESEPRPSPGLDSHLPGGWPRGFLSVFPPHSILNWNSNTKIYTEKDDLEVLLRVPLKPARAPQGQLGDVLDVGETCIPGPSTLLLSLDEKPPIKVRPLT